MNLYLFHSKEISDGRARISGVRLKHLLQVQRLKKGDKVRVGIINGEIGTAQIIQLDSNVCLLEVNLTDIAPDPLPLKLIMALPRPKMLRRTMQTVAAMGVKEIHLINSWRVEKSFWQTPLLDPEAIEEELITGLQQARDTILPKVHIHPLFKPFAEDELPSVVMHTRPLLAHPAAAQNCPVDVPEPVTLAVGPEGGFIPYEVEKFMACGFMPVNIGPRILRVETAVPVLLSRLYPGR